MGLEFIARAILGRVTGSLTSFFVSTPLRRGRAAWTTHSQVLSPLALLISTDSFLLFLYSFLVIANCYLTSL